MDLPVRDADRGSSMVPAPPSLNVGPGITFLMTNREGSMSVEELEAEALKLPPIERERLAARLLSSVGSRLEYEAEWIEEVERRARELDEGTVDTIPADQVIREALDRLK
jgi:putative addiction module component (TIGR02574 family)